MPGFRLNVKQLDRLSEILGNLSLLILATFVLPFILGSEKFDIIKTLGGGITSVGTFILSLIFLKKELRK